MTTSSGQRGGVPMTAQKFFKIVMDSEADCLRIPPEFKKRNGHNLPNRVSLKVPSGSTMEVELNECDGKTWLQKGWKEFKERYSIGFGYFLVFIYDGESEFDILIFDTTGSEIIYPSLDTNNKTVEPKLEDNGMESYDSGGFLEDISTDNKERKGENQEKTTKHLSSGLKKDSRSKLDVSTPEKCSDGSGKRCLDKVEMKRAYRKAMDFVSDYEHSNPFFVSLMHPYHVSSKYTLKVPLAFARRNLPRKGSNSITMVMDGKEWSVRCHMGDGHATIMGGWRSFVRENGVKLGDACIFEVANKNKNLVWNVVIFRI